MNLLIIFSINWLNVLSINYQKIKKNGRYNFPLFKVTSSNVSFCPTNGPKPKDDQFIIMYDKQQHHILTFSHFYQNYCWLILYQQINPCSSKTSNKQNHSLVEVVTPQKSSLYRVIKQNKVGNHRFRLYLYSSPGIINPISSLWSQQQAYTHRSATGARPSS